MTDTKDRSRYQERHHPLTGLILFFVGIVFLLNNFNVLDFRVWTILINFWPVILIIWGLERIFENSYITRSISYIIGILIFGFVIAYSVANTNPSFSNWLDKNIPGWKNFQSHLDTSTKQKNYYWQDEDIFENQDGDTYNI